MPSHKTIRWRPLDESGLEHLELTISRDVVTARSAIIGARAGWFYEMTLAPDWTFRHIAITRTDGAWWTLTVDGKGNWRDDKGLRPDLDGCIDIDLSGSPFTNTLPILRVPLEIGVPQNFTMAWISLDALTVKPHRQIYTALGGNRYRYENGDGSFSAELVVDDDGLVLDYPTLFARV
jgi:uncharacterized protein